MTSKLGPNGIRDDRLMDEITRILLEAIDNPCGGLFASEIHLTLAEKDIHVSAKKIGQMIKYHGKRIKIQPININSSTSLNLYSTSPQLDFSRRKDKT